MVLIASLKEEKKAAFLNVETPQPEDVRLIRPLIDWNVAF